MEFERERQRFDRTKYVNEMKVTELEEEVEKQKNRVQDLQKKLGSASQELKENQNLLVPKNRNGRSTATNTDCDNVSVQNTATSPGVSQENALRNALDSRSPSKSPVAPKTYDFNSIYKILNPLTFKGKPQVSFGIGKNVMRLVIVQYLKVKRFFFDLRSSRYNNLG